MREKYWAMYESVKHSERYFFYYRERAWKWDKGIKAFLVIASLSSVANLAFWDQISITWAIIAMAAQILSALAYLIPFSDQVTALNSFLPEIDKLLCQIDHDWDRINILQELSDVEINDLVLKYNLAFSDLEDRYTRGIQFSVNAECETKAEADCKKFKFSRFGITQTDYLEEALTGVQQ